MNQPAVIKASSNKPFIEANTIETNIVRLKGDCVVPVFSKDNEITISHPLFIETVWQAAKQFFEHETISAPEIRVSHIIKGRTPDAIHKAVNQLVEKDKTMYYERMMFCIEIPSIAEDIAGNRLVLTIGGVRAYNHMNLYCKKTVEKFKLFIGFKNSVCCNMCISTDGYQTEIQAFNADDIFQAATVLFSRYNMSVHLNAMKELPRVHLSEHQFAQFVGKSRLYQNLPVEQKKMLPELLITDTQINLVAKAYFNDKNFSVDRKDQQISLWRVYNLLTGANKTSYIDNFLDRSLNANDLAIGLQDAVSGEGAYRWFLS